MPKVDSSTHVLMSVTILAFHCYVSNFHFHGCHRDHVVSTSLQQGRFVCMFPWQPSTLPRALHTLSLLFHIYATHTAKNAL